jgi:hypothetical protein
MELPVAAHNKMVDIGAILDESPFTTLQMWVVILAAASTIFDGLGSHLAPYNNLEPA